MDRGTEQRPLRVAVIGSGPAGFYAVQSLFRTDGLVVAVDMFERLPAPFGLVRYGVAPDHPKIKSVTAVYDKLASRDNFRFYGNVDYGRDLTLADLAAHYDQILFSTGAQTDRRLGIPGETLARSHPATEFVAWYNGHPEFSHLEFDLSRERAVVIGVGNVAVDVARILCRSSEELARTDIADYALEALGRSRVREVYLLGRRGPAQAAFTNPEIKELGELAQAATSTRPDEVALDGSAVQALDRATRRKVEILQGYADFQDPQKPKKLIVRFLVSPTELLGDDDGGVKSVRLVRNELYTDESGGLRARATERTETIDAGLVFRSVGYRGVPLADLPFDEKRGLVPHKSGRVVDPDTGKPLCGLYVAGWIKRGPSGVIGTNKADAAETVKCMLDDLRQEAMIEPAEPLPGAVERRLSERSVRFITYEDWRALDATEVSRGKDLGRPRVKFTDREAFLNALALG